MKPNYFSAGFIALTLAASPVCFSQTNLRTPTPKQASPSAHSATRTATAQPGSDRFFQTPLQFEANQGQAPAEYRFVAHGPSYFLGISTTGLALSLSNPKPQETKDSRNALPRALEQSGSSHLELRFAGSARDSQLTGINPQPGRSNYFIGNDPARWQTNIPHFSQVQLANVYQGIDLVLYGNQQQLEYDFDVAPGADPNQIRLQTTGADSVRLDAAGNSILSTAIGDVEIKRPVAYQIVNGARKSVESEFEITERNELKISIGEYDRSRELVIDPVLQYAVVFGGSNGNQATGIALNAAGDVYVTGNTCSAEFTTTPGSFQTIHTDPIATACQDGFVTEFDPTGSTMIFSDFIGGAGGITSGMHLTVDTTGNVYLAGATGSPNFPTASNIGPATLSTCSMVHAGYDCPDGFILKLSPDGSQILWSSLLGGTQSSGAFQVKLNPVTGDVTVLGATDSSNFQPAPTTLETAFAGATCSGGIPCFNGFLLGLNPANGQLRWGTFLGGGGNDWSAGLAFDTNGNVYVAGSAQPPLSGALGTVTHTYAPAGGATVSGSNLYVAKLNLAGTTLTPGYLTLVQGDADTAATTLVVDSANNAYFGGATAAQHLGVTAGVFQSANKDTTGNNCLWGPYMTPFLPSACGTGLIGELDSTGALSFLTYLGGSAQDEVEAIGLDSSKNIWITGITSSSDFPYSAGVAPAHQGFWAPFLAEMSSTGATVPYATPVGGPLGQSADLAVDSGNNVYIAGFASSVSATPGTYPDDATVFNPAFVQKWVAGSPPSLTLSLNNLGFGTIAIGTSSQAQTATIQNTGVGPMELGIQLANVYSGQTAGDFLMSTTCGSTLAAGSSCTITVIFQPGPPPAGCAVQQGCNPASRSAQIVILNNAPQGTQTIALSGSTAVGPSVSIVPNSVVFPAQAPGTSSTPIYLEVGSDGDAPLNIGNIALSGPNASEFTVITSGLGGPSCTTVYPGTYCSVEITFNPAANASGTRTASLTFTDGAADSPQVVSLSGTVATPNFLNISPLTLTPSFPVAFGTSSFSVLNLQNPSPTNSVQVTGLVIAGTNMGDFSAGPSNCGTSGALPMTIPPNSTCYVDVTFNPAAGASGSRTATLTVQTTPAATGLPTVSLLAYAVTNSDPHLSTFTVPSPMNFGGLQVGETSNNASVLFNVSNNAPIPCAGGASTCGAPLIISSITPGLSDYTLMPQGSGCTPFPVTIQVGSNCTYALVFTPSQAGLRNTNVTIASNDPQGNVQLPVFGSGLSIPLGEFLQTALNFGNSAIGVAAPPLTTTLLNSGQSALNVSSVVASTNFAVTANNCTTPLAPQATCTISISFTPPAAGFFSGTLTITDNDSLGTQQSVNLTGTGATGPQLRIMPPTLNFGNQVVNVASTAQTITFTSTGDSTVTLPANSIRTSPPYSLQSTTCGTTLAVGASCTASVQYKPSVVTGIPDSGVTLVTDNVTGSPQPVYMQGTAIQGGTATSTISLKSSLNPSSSGQNVTVTATVAGLSGNPAIPTGVVDFFDVATYIGSGALNSAGQATLTTSSLSVGSHSLRASYYGDANFASSGSLTLTQVVNASTLLATSTSVASSLNPSTSGTAVTFTATVTWPSGASTNPTGAVIFYDAGTVLGGANLNASGLATLTISSLSVGTHSVTGVYGGDTSFSGSTSLALSQVVNGIVLPASTTALTSSLNPSGTGQSVTFSATVTGPNGNPAIPTGTVTFKDGTSSLGTGVLNGSGVATYTTSALSTGSHSITAAYPGDTNFAGSSSNVITQSVGTPSFTVGANPSTVTVTAGQTATTTLSVTPAYGFNQTVSFACSGLPVASTCTFSPATLTPNGTTAATTTLTIATNVATASLTKPEPPNHRKLSSPSQALLALILLGLGGAVRWRRYAKAWLLGTIFLAAFGLAVTGCGGNSNNTSTSGGGSSSTTPKGTSTITVNVAAGGQSQSATFTLIVQ